LLKAKGVLFRIPSLYHINNSYYDSKIPLMHATYFSNPLITLKLSSNITDLVYLNTMSRFSGTHDE